MPLGRSGIVAVALLCSLNALASGAPRAARRTTLSATSVERQTTWGGGPHTVQHELEYRVEGHTRAEDFERFAALPFPDDQGRLRAADLPGWKLSHTGGADPMGAWGKGSQWRRMIAFHHEADESITLKYETTFTQTHD